MAMIKIIISIFILSVFSIKSLASDYDDFKSCDKDKNNNDFIEMVTNHIGKDPSSLRFLVLDGPRLGTSKAIYEHFEKTSMVKPQVWVPQISKADFDSMKETKTWDKYKPGVVLSSFKTYLDQIELRKDYAFIPNAVYLDCMGSAGGNQEKENFPFEDLKQYLKLAATRYERVTIGITLSLRTIDKPLSPIPKMAK